MKAQLHSFLTSALYGVKCPTAVLARQKLPCTVNSRLRGIQDRYGPFEKRKMLFLLLGIEPWFLGCPAVRLVST